MNRKDAAEYVKSRYADYLRPAKKKGTFICPVCGNCPGEGCPAVPPGPDRRPGNGENG